MVILTILIFLTHEHSVSWSVCIVFHFISVLQFSEYSSSTSLGTFIPGYFILFDAIVNGIVSWMEKCRLCLREHSRHEDFLLGDEPALCPGCGSGCTNVYMCKIHRPVYRKDKSQMLIDWGPTSNYKTRKQIGRNTHHEIMRWKKKFKKE